MPPAKTLREAYNAANPTEPLSPGDPRYVDCTDVRGDEDTVRKMFRIISYSDKATHQLFTGHRGCGKSTELLRLKKRLEGDKFYVVYFAADEDLDAKDLTYTDLLLSIARRVIAQTSEDEINLGDALKTVETWFSEVVYEQSEWKRVEHELTSQAEISVSLPKGIPLIGRLLTRLTEPGDQSAVANTLHNLAILAQAQGDIDEARRLYKESFDISKALGNQNGVASILHELGRLAQGQGKLEEARHLYKESFDILKRIGNQSSIAISLHQLGVLAEDKSNKAEAARLYREALSIFERLGSPNAEIARRNLARVEGSDDAPN